MFDEQKDTKINHRIYSIILGTMGISKMILKFSNLKRVIYWAPHPIPQFLGHWTHTYCKYMEKIES